MKKIIAFALSLAESNAALVASQQTAQAAQALHAGTMQKQLTNSGADQEESITTAKRFFACIFGQKRHKDYLK